MKKIEDHLKTWNCDVACWGERNVVKHKQMETEMMEKCMLQPVNPLMVGQSQAVPKALPLILFLSTISQHPPTVLDMLPSTAILAREMPETWKSSWAMLPCSRMELKAR